MIFFLKSNEKTFAKFRSSQFCKFTLQFFAKFLDFWWIFLLILLVRFIQYKKTRSLNGILRFISKYTYYNNLKKLAQNKKTLKDFTSVVGSICPVSSLFSQLFESTMKKRFSKIFPMVL